MLFRTAAAERSEYARMRKMITFVGLVGGACASSARLTFGARARIREARAQT